MAAPAPSALQWSSLMPHPRKTTPNRFGNAAGVAVSAKASRDSSHGNAMAQPAPRSTVRREMRGAEFLVDSGIFLTFSIVTCRIVAFWGFSRLEERRGGGEG